MERLPVDEARQELCAANEELRLKETELHRELVKASSERETLAFKSQIANDAAERRAKELKKNPNPNLNLQVDAERSALEAERSSTEDARATVEKRTEAWRPRRTLSGTWSRKSKSGKTPSSRGRPPSTR